nr:hypothetical protein [Rhizobium sp. NXC24]
MSKATFNFGQQNLKIYRLGEIIGCPARNPMMTFCLSVIAVRKIKGIFICSESLTEKELSEISQL